MKKAILLLSIVLVLLLPSLALAAPPADSGFTAKIVATPHQVITGTINAAGYDIGVYVGPGVTGVVIKNAYISGANDHGIYIQDTSNIVVKNSVVTGNGVNPHAGLTEDKAIALAGTHNVLIQHNNVSYNLVDGGISVIDDGPINPAQPNPGSLHLSSDNVIMGNLIQDNIGACGIVVASKNAAGGVKDTLVKGNTVIGNSPGQLPPSIGGIVIAGYLTTDTVIADNVVKGGWLAGIVIHVPIPGEHVDGTAILHNTLISNGPSDAPDKNTAGISILAGPGEITNTRINHNTVINDYYGVWHLGDTNTEIMHMKGNAVVPTAP